MTHETSVSDRRLSIVRWLLAMTLPLAILSVLRAINEMKTPSWAPVNQVERVIEKDGRRFLFGGPKETDHFDITVFRLDPGMLHYGLGREAFPALISPKFDTVDIADQWLNELDRVLTVVGDNIVRVYPIRLLMRHEVVNDIIDGIPIFAAYCVLADLGAVYDRRVGGQTLTFGVSGYTYFDPAVWDGRDAFVLWDRETESLWWPPIGRAVSGPLIDRSLSLLDETMWSQMTWGSVRKVHPDAQVLKPHQEYSPPLLWPSLHLKDFDAPSSAQVKIAPRWPSVTP